MECMEEVDFDAYFGGGSRTWSTTLSDGTLHVLRPEMADTAIMYEERLEYIQALVEARMSESSEQVPCLMSLALFRLLALLCLLTLPCLFILPCLFT